jgi:hypothetical protein
VIVSDQQVRMGAPIRALVVGIPARDEADHIVGAIEALRVAADALSERLLVRIVVACDSCADATGRNARTIAATDDRIVVIEGEWRAAGAARRAAIDVGLQQLAQLDIPVDACWIAATDADTVVPPEWLTLQVAYAADGVDAVAGIIGLRDDGDLTDRLAFVFERTYPVEESGHSHVHGANLGVRAAAYRAVGGFPELAVAEDHALWNALRTAGFRCLASLALHVSTSARLQGRAPGGFADTLRDRLAMHGHAIASSPAAQPA